MAAAAAVNEHNPNVIFLSKNQASILRSRSDYFSNINPAENYEIRIDDFPETFTYYDEDYNTTYEFSKREVFNALRDILFTGHISNYPLAKFIKNFFMFRPPKSNLESTRGEYNFFNLLIPEPMIEKPKKPKGSFYGQLGKKTRQKIRAAMNINSEDNNDKYDDDDDRDEIINELIANYPSIPKSKVEMLFKNYTKYGKSKRPSKTKRNTNTKKISNYRKTFKTSKKF